MGYHAGKAIESRGVYCFYKMTLRHVSVFYEFTGPINLRFLTNQNARSILAIFLKKNNGLDLGTEPSCIKLC